MPIRKEWSQFNAQQVSAVPETDGVYELGADENKIIYIGGSLNLRQSLEEHLKGDEDWAKKARLFRYEENFMYTTRQSELIQAFIRLNKRLPEGNAEII